MHVPSLRRFIAANLAQRAAGRARSEADAALHRRMVGFFRELVLPGDLVFDVGANVGAKTAAFLEVGAEVVAIEPQGACVAQLRQRFAADDRVHVVEMALAPQPGDYVLRINRIDVISSMSREWMDAVEASGRFGDHSAWIGEERVEATTLDLLIGRFGMPRLCKIDVEGFEPEVLAGLTQSIELVSFEFTAEVLDRALRCIELLARLGSREFGLSFGETLEIDGGWVGRATIEQRLGDLADRMAWGDVYARVPKTQATSFRGGVKG